eukprot:COSAG01_NODE_9059_length_2566_cov_5118.369274_1_plen_172_part_10
MVRPARFWKSPGSCSSIRAARSRPSSPNIPCGARPRKKPFSWCVPRQGLSCLEWAKRHVDEPDETLQIDLGGTIRYNHNYSYVTHISVQCHNAECVDTAKSNYVAKPIVMDEVRYEGNISTRWGSMSADEMTQRFWIFFAKGAYCGHSETVLPGNWSTAGSPCHEPRCDHPI